MALTPRPRRRDRAGGGRGATLDLTPADPRRPLPDSQSRSTWRGRADSDATWSASPSSLDALQAEFTGSWERGESPSIEEYVARLGPDAGDGAVALIYHAYCLAESAGLDPIPADYISRFPALSDSLERLFRLQDALGASGARSWADPAILPEVGDEIGPYRLIRTLGEGGFARVFLAEQADLDHRPVVVKVSTRITSEPRLLARARHTHIVEVLWHGLIDEGALQLICMPFLGGATLADVLAGRRRRGGSPRSGRDLLDDLDRASAPEYPAANLARPARESIARLPYPKAVAWLVARLAEALDYAYGRGVLHGDLKPSNILLTANGEPMLLDFNLSVGWRSPVGDDLPEDAGGTLAYMAPERLRAITHPEEADPPDAADRHRADVFSLGMVLLEVLAGRTPDQPRGVAPSPRRLAAAFAQSRQQGAETLIRSCRVALAPGLRSIVTRCLATDPADRYRRASELAEDLDRWCGDRPLLFAPEPAGSSRVWRWARRRRRAVAAAVLSIVVGTVTTLAVWDAAQVPIREQARAKLAQLWDDVESKVFHVRQFGQWRDIDVDAPEEAFRHLAHYHVLDAADWRTREDYRALPEDERPELEIWLLEQALRLGRGLRARPDSPDDWRRGLEVLERVAALRPVGPLVTQCRLLRQQLGLPGTPAPDAPAPEAEPTPRWMEEYLLGVEAEPTRAKDARAHYQNVLRERPDSFWGHYRAATVAHRLGDRAAAAGHLERCVARRPENPALRGQLAGCLFKLNRLDAALEQCNQALALNPDHAESYRTRALIRGRLGQSEALRSDIGRFETLTRHLGKVPAWRLRLDGMLSGLTEEPHDRDLVGNDLSWRLLTVDPDEVDLRTALALQLQATGDLELALVELDKVLEIAPDHLRARYLRGGLHFRLRDDKADEDFSYLLEHPRFEELLAESDSALHAFLYDSWVLSDRGEAEKALRVASRGLLYAERLGKMRGESHYALARAHAVAARSDPGQLERAADHLRSAYLYNPKYLRAWFGSDSAFDDRREAIERMILDRFNDAR